ncbi:MAG TPA: hypothetical protein PK339_05730 [Flavitalea sp.]|nr:hypothetical protein [Flavitalea sp.]
MSHDLLNILSHSNKDIDNQKLMDYLGGKLSEGEKYEVERWMADNEFASDAMEGLEQANRDNSLPQYLEQLNKELSQYISQKKQKREKRRFTIPAWSYLAVLLILALAIIVYFVIRKFHEI